MRTINKTNRRFTRVRGDNRRRIREALFHDQFGICAYTERKLRPSEIADIDHFNPQIKDTNQDNYQNWFLIDHTFNNKKSNHWVDPVVNPTDQSLNDRLVYYLNRFSPKNLEDVAIKNLINLVDLNNKGLVDERERCIGHLKFILKMNSVREIISDPDNHHCIEFATALQVTFADLDGLNELLAIAKNNIRPQCDYCQVKANFI